MVAMTREEYRSSLKGRRCYVGMDLSSTTDLTALVAVFPDDDGECFDVLAHFFVPEDNIYKRGLRDRVPYKQWEQEGFLTATPGNSISNQAVRRQLQEWDQEFSVQEIGLDPWNAHDIVDQLEKQDGFTCVAIRQGMQSLSGPTKSLEKAILSKRLRHDGHPILRWCVGNVAVITDDNENFRPSKKVSTERIDGVIALVMAIDRMERNWNTRPPDYSMFTMGGVR